MRWMVIAAVVLTASACSDDPSGPDALPIHGNYTLQSVNGRPLPLELFNLSGGVFIITQTGGKLIMNADHTFREEDYLETRFSDAQGAPVVERDSAIFTGTWENQDSVVTWTTTRRIIGGIDEAYSETMFGVVNKGRLTLNFESGDSLFTYVYMRN